MNKEIGQKRHKVRLIEKMKENGYIGYDEIIYNMEMNEWWSFWNAINKSINSRDFALTEYVLNSITINKEDN